MIKYHFIYKNKCVFILVLIGIIIYTLNYLTPLNWDDYSYKFITENNTDKNSLRLVNNFSDIIISQSNHYFSINGRSLCHFFVQLFSGIIGKEIFNFVNTFVFVSFIILLTLYSNKIDLLNILFTFSLVFLLFPALNETILWMTGSINYLWTCTGIILFLCLFKYFSYTTFKKNYYCIILFIISLILGWSNEGISLPLAGTLIIYFLWKRFNLNTFQLFLILGFITGSFICSFAPSTINRSEVTQSSFTYIILHKGEAFLIVLAKLRALYALFFLFLIKYFLEFKSSKNLLLKFCQENIILIGSWFCSFFIIFIAGQTDTRSAVGVEFFSILIILSLFQYGKVNYYRYFKFVLCILTFILLPFIVYYSYVNYKNFKTVEYQLTKTNNNIILYDDIHIPSFIKQFIMVPRSYNFISCGLGNSALNLFYGKRNIIFLPYQIYQDLKNRRNIIYNLNLQGDYKFYVMPLEDMDRKTIPYFILNPDNDADIPIILRHFKNKLDRYSATEIPAQDYQFININGDIYLIIGRNEIVDKRVNSIILKNSI